MKKAKLIISVLLISLMAVTLLSSSVFATLEFQDSFEYADWPAMSATGWTWDTTKTDPAIGVQFLGSTSTPPVTPVHGNKVIRFDGSKLSVLIKKFTKDYAHGVFKCYWYYNPSEGRDPINSYFGVKSLSGKYVIVRAGAVDTATNKRWIQARWNTSTAVNIALLQDGWNYAKVVYEPVPDTALSNISIYLNGILIAQKTNFDAGGGIGEINLGRPWGETSTGDDVLYDRISLSDAAHYIKPHAPVVGTGGTIQLAFDTGTANQPVAWTKVAGDGDIVSNGNVTGLFTAGSTPGPVRIRATDLEGNTDEMVVNVVQPTIDPSPTSVVLGTTATFTFAPSTGTVNWAVQNESGGTGSVGTIDPATGVFTPVATGICEVTASDSSGNTGVASVTVVGPGIGTYVTDSNTLALYHLDEGSGQSWYDSTVNNLTGATLTPSLPLYHVSGYFGNAASGFRASGSNYTCINVPPTAALNTEELTAEAWIKTGTDTTGGTIGHTIVCRRSPDSWGLSIGAYGTYGVAGQLTFIWWPLNAETTLTSKDFNGGAGLALQPETWYHVAATFKRISNTAPKPTYEVKLYCTPAGETTPVEVASKTTTYALNQNSGLLRIGGETDYRRAFPGLIDEVRISSRARTPEELSWTLGAGLAEKVADPVFTPGTGSYNTKQMVSISCATPGVTIYYTIDGIDPTVYSFVYDGTPIPVFENTTLKAMAVKDGLVTGYATAKYTFPN